MGVSLNWPDQTYSSTNKPSDVTLKNDLSAIEDDLNAAIHADGSVAFSANQSMGSNKLTNVADPTSAQDAATKNYVDTEAVDKTGWVPVSDTWTYASADAPTYVITVPSGAASVYAAGMKVKFTQPTDGVKYGIITKVADTALTVYMGTDYDLDNEAITSPYYSVVRAPFGFPLDPSKWTVRVTDDQNRPQSNPSAGVWYNLGGTNSQITIPIGAWRVSYWVTLLTTRADQSVYVTLSTASDSETLTDMTIRQFVILENGVLMCASRSKYITLAAKTTYYLNAKVSGAVSQSISFNNADDGDMVLEAVCAYL